MLIIIPYCNTKVKVISSSNIFLSSIVLIKKKKKNATIYNSRNKGVKFMT